MRLCEHSKNRRVGRRRALPFALSLIAWIPAPCRADDKALESMRLASDLGDIIASEEFCNLSYDQDAIARFINLHVRDNDLHFASELEAMVQSHRYELNRMPPSLRTAQCTQTTRVARAFGFIP